MEAVAAAIRLGRDSGARVVLDPAPPAPLPDDLLRLVDVIRTNADEATSLTGVQVHDQVSARHAAAKLLQRGVGAVAIGVGPQGNLIVGPEGERWNPGIPVKSVDATGAGDAFVGALAAEIARARPLAEAAHFANAAAALATTQFGAQAGLPTRDDVLRLLAKQEG